MSVTHNTGLQRYIRAESKFLHVTEVNSARLTQPPIPQGSVNE